MRSDRGGLFKKYSESPGTGWEKLFRKNVGTPAPCGPPFPLKELVSETTGTRRRFPSPISGTER